MANLKCKLSSQPRVQGPGVKHGTFIHSL